MSRQKWNKKLNYMYPLLTTKLNSSVHMPQLVFFALSILSKLQELQLSMRNKKITQRFIHNVVIK